MGLSVNKLVKFIIALITIVSTDGRPLEGNPAAVSKVNNDTGIYHDIIFEGYDCTDPRSLHDSGFIDAPSCQSDATVAEAKPVEYQLAYRSKMQKVKGRSCEMILTRYVRYCGAYDHETKLVQTTELPKTVPVYQCSEWHSSLQFEDPKGGKHLLRVDAINVVSYFEKGKTYISPGSQQVSCEGEEMTEGDEKLYHMVIDVQAKIILRNENFALSSKEVIAQTRDIRLPCSGSVGSCQLADVTYTWDQPDTCELAYVKNIQGTEVVSNKGEVVFMSTDDSLVRLIKRDPVSLCGKVVYTTNLEDWYMHKPKENAPPAFTRRILPSEVSIVTYVNNRDEYLYNHIADRIEEELRGVLTNDCNGQVQRMKLDFWLQHNDPSLTAWILGKGVFATTSGEVIYHYQCPSVMVRAIYLPKCYAALPVQANPGTNSKLATTKRQLFMEPLTHKLTYTGIEMPCSNVFRAKYHSLGGSWVEATPDVQIASPPRLPHELVKLAHVYRDRPDFNKGGGLYSPDTLDQMDYAREFGRTANGLNYHMAMNAGRDYYQNGGYLAQNVFPEMKDPKWMTGMWDRTKGFLHRWGEAASILISLYGIFSFTSTVVSWFFGARAIRDVHGIGKRIFWALCPNLFLLRRYRDQFVEPTEEKTPVCPLQNGDTPDPEAQRTGFARGLFPKLDFGNP